MEMESRSLLGRAVESVRGLKFTVNEWTGALGDLGTFAPIFLAMVGTCGVSPSRMLFLTGLAYISAGLIFGLPMPIQPLKAMAAISIAAHLSPAHISAGAIWMGLILIPLSLGGGLKWLERFFPPPVVKGVQLGVGLLLLKAAWALLAHGVPQVKAAQAAAWGLPTARVMWESLWLLVIPQIPLTLGNACYAVSDVAKVYFKEKAGRATPTNCALSIGVSDLAIGLLGGVPICHGSGGMTAHYRFGARTAGATVIIGSLFIALPLLLGRNSFAVFTAMPAWLLAAAVAYVGLCHVWLLKNLKERFSVALLIGGVSLWTANITYALFAGLALDWLLRAIPLLGARIQKNPA